MAYLPMVSLDLCMVWHGIRWYGLRWLGCCMVCWVNSGMGIALVRVGKVYQGTLYPSPLLSPLLTLPNPSHGYLPSVLGLLWVHVYGCAFGLLPVLGDCWCLACPVRHGNGQSGARLPAVVVARCCRVLSVPFWIGDCDTGWPVRALSCF